MKVLLILAWAIISAAIFWWPRPTFQTRWVAMPPAMSWQTLNAAHKAAERPVGMTYTYCKYPDCKRG